MKAKSIPSNKHAYNSGIVYPKHTIADKIPNLTISIII